MTLYSEPLYTMELEGEYLHLKMIRFHDAELYQLFIDYLNKSKLIEMRDNDPGLSLFDYSKNPRTEPVYLQYDIKNCWGTENIVGKFFLETGLDWPEDYQKSENYEKDFKQMTMNPPGDKYNQGNPKVYLGRQGAAEIPQDIMERMKAFRVTQGAALSASFFSFDSSKIAYTSHGTSVSLATTSPELQQWFTDFQGSQTVMGFNIFKVNERAIAINSGPGTPGIQIKKEGDHYFVCNNITADKDLKNRDQTFKTFMSQLNRIISASQESLQSQHSVSRKS